VLEITIFLIRYIYLKKLQMPANILLHCWHSVFKLQDPRNGNSIRKNVYCSHSYNEIMSMCRTGWPANTTPRGFLPPEMSCKPRTLVKNKTGLKCSCVLGVQVNIIIFCCAVNVTVVLIIRGIYLSAGTLPNSIYNLTRRF
jgi:hypothetical protein